MMVGAEANKLALQEKQDNFLSEDAWNIVLRDLFSGSIMMKDNEEHRRLRRIMQTAFHKKPLISYLKVINDTTEAYLDHEFKVENGVVKIYPAFEKLTLLIAGKLFFGVEFDEEHLEAIRQVTHASADPLHLNIPFSKYWHGIKARKLLTDFYSKRIATKRSHPQNDLFSYMCVARSEMGETFTDEEIINQMIFLMMASHDTTTSTVSSMIYETARAPEWQNEMWQECNGINKDGPVEYSQLKEFEIVGRVFNECLRLHPALVAFPRLTTKEIIYKGFRVPAYTNIGITPYLSHLDPNYFPDPEKFDPNRFSPERAEHKKHSHAFIPFGAGHHVCIGKYFAEMEAKIIMHHFVQKFKWSVEEGYTVRYLPPLNHPEDGLVVNIEHRMSNAEI